jgi:hypothetical protein
LSNDIVTGLGVLILVVGLMIIFYAYLRLERLLDRYRLKYGFDREVEGKETNGDNKEEKLNRSERSFKRRVFKD